MLERNWKKIKIISIIGVGIIVLSIYLYLILTSKTSIPYQEIITLPVSGIELPYWLLMGLGIILLPGFAVGIMYEILDKIEEKKF